jgi:DNA mismatch repair ATPase MutS
VIDRAWKVLEELEAQSQAGGSSFQLHLFAGARTSKLSPPEAEVQEIETTPPHPIFQELELADVNQLTPMQALQFVVKLKDLSVMEKHSD